MDRVTVAELKARLSHYLREVREGKSFTVVSRDIPVATLGPYDPMDVDDLKIVEPSANEADWGRVDLPPLHRQIDAVALLRADRDVRDDFLAQILHEGSESRSAEQDEP